MGNIGELSPEIVYRGLNIFKSVFLFIKWMNTPLQSLSNETPLNLLKCEGGPRKVLDELILMENGVPS